MNQRLLKEQAKALRLQNIAQVMELGSPNRLVEQVAAVNQLIGGQNQEARTQAAHEGNATQQALQNEALRLSNQNAPQQAQQASALGEAQLQALNQANQLQQLQIDGHGQQQETNNRELDIRERNTKAQEINSIAGLFNSAHNAGNTSNVINSYLKQLGIDGELTPHFNPFAQQEQTTSPEQQEALRLLTERLQR